MARRPLRVCRVIPGYRPARFIWGTQIARHLPGISPLPVNTARARTGSPVDRYRSAGSYQGVGPLIYTGHADCLPPTRHVIAAHLPRQGTTPGWGICHVPAVRRRYPSVTPVGGHVVQSQAAGIEPHVDMNLILLKPEAEARSQVVLLGRRKARCWLGSTTVSSRNCSPTSWPQPHCSNLKQRDCSLHLRQWPRRHGHSTVGGRTTPQPPCHQRW